MIDRIVVIHLERNTPAHAAQDLADFMEEDSLNELDKWINSDLMAELSGTKASVPAKVETPAPVVTPAPQIQNPAPVAKPVQAPVPVAKETTAPAKPIEAPKPVVSAGSMMMEEQIPEVSQIQPVVHDQTPTPAGPSSNGQTLVQRDTLVLFK